MLAVRNDPGGLEKAARSVLGQRGVSLELIVVDDGSSDGTRTALDRLAGEDPRVRRFAQSPMGLTRALVRGCREARGAAIARQDAGDLSAPERLKHQVEALGENPDVVLVSCWTACVAPKGEFLYLQKGASEPRGPERILSEETPLTVTAGPTSHGSALFRRDAYEAAGGYRPEFALGQDWDLWQRMGLRGRYVEVDQMLYERTLSPDSLSFRFPDLQREFGRLSLEATRSRAAGVSEAPWLARAADLSARVEALRQRRGRAGVARGLYHVGEALRRRHDPGSLDYLRAATRAAPAHWKGWIRRIQAELAFGPKALRRSERPSGRSGAD